MDKNDSIQLLQSHGIKPTVNRILVVKALAEEDQPLSMSDLEDRLVTVDKSGIFRSLVLFRDHHLVHSLEDGAGAERYELCLKHDDEGDDDDIHVHFYCERCHRVYCFYDTPIPQVDVPDGFRPTSANYMIKGICPKCQKS